MRMIVATISICKQIGESEFQQDRYSRVYDETMSMRDILLWAEKMGLRNASINDIQFSEYTGESSGGWEGVSMDTFPTP